MECNKDVCMLKKALNARNLTIHQIQLHDQNFGDDEQ
jgi:hypothetical protein